MNKKAFISFIISIIILMVVFCIAIMVGQYNISINDFFTAMFTNSSTVDIQRNIIMNLRLPRTIIAGLSGIALSVSGLIYQEIFQNKLTSPDLLGVSSGASVGAAIAILLGLSPVFISSFSFVMGIITVIITVLLAKVFRNVSSISLILSGIVVSGFMSALLSLVKYFADPTTTLATISYWLMGSFQNCTMNTVYYMFPIVTVCCTALLLLAWRINIIALGEEETITRGINYKAYKNLLIGISTLLTASSVAFCGVISWVGLVIPHLVRLIADRDTRGSIPLCITFGGCFMILVDICSRSFTMQEMPLSSVTGTLGTILFVTIIFINRRNYNVH